MTNPTEKRDSVIQKKKIMLHKTKEHATDVIPTTIVESWRDGWEIKFDMFRNYDGKEYGHGLHQMLKQFISSQIQQAEERLVERIEKNIYGKIIVQPGELKSFQGGTYANSSKMPPVEVTIRTIKEEKDL